jgi:uncharacterized membrane protein
MLETHWKDLLVTFGISMLPVVELRGGIPFAAVHGIPFGLAFAVSFLGNILPVPFILLLLRRVFQFMEQWKLTRRVVLGLERRARKHTGTLDKYALLGLFILVAIPLPGTGAWTGSLVAVVFDIQIRRAFPVIALGVLTAGIIMTVLSYLIPGLFFDIGA